MVEVQRRESEGGGGGAQDGLSPLDPMSKDLLLIMQYTTRDTMLMLDSTTTTTTSLSVSETASSDALF